jgi:hypothetical protein
MSDNGTTRPNRSQTFLKGFFGVACGFMFMLMVWWMVDVDVGVGVDV